MSKVLAVFGISNQLCAIGDVSLMYEAYEFSSLSGGLGDPFESSGLRFASSRSF